MSAEPILVTDRARRMSVRIHENTQGEGRGNFLLSRNRTQSRAPAARRCGIICLMVSKVLMSRRESRSRLPVWQTGDAPDFFDSAMQVVPAAEVFPGPRARFHPKWFKPRKNL